MPRNSVDRNIIADRQRRVAQMRLRHLTLREIVRGLETMGMQNPRTGHAWGLATVFRDMTALDSLWKRQSLGDTSRVKAEIWAELREARRAAWQTQDMTTVLRSIKQECELLGLDAPMRHDYEGRIRLLAESEGLDPDEAVREAQRILARWEVGSASR